MDKANLKPIFSALQKFSSIDYEGTLAMILFTGGCNFRCSFCHNPDFVIPNRVKFMPVEESIEFLEKRKNTLDSVVICGGEPTLHNENLVNWARYIKSLGYNVKLDTNATKSKIIKQLLDENLVDFFAVDYKAPIARYEKITNMPINKDELMEGLKMIIDSGVRYEMRTTIHSDLHTKADISKMICELKELGANTYYLQAFRMPNDSVGEVTDGIGTQSLVKEFDEILKENFENGEVRNLN